MNDIDKLMYICKIARTISDPVVAHAIEEFVSKKGKN